MLVPIIADELFEFKPPTKYIVITVERIPVRTADAIGQNPLNIIGNNIKNIKAIVDIIEIILVNPFFLPIKSKRIKNIPVNIKIWLSLLISAIKKSTSSGVVIVSEFGSTCKTTLSPLVKFMSYAGFPVSIFSIRRSVPLKFPVRTFTVTSCFVVDSPWLRFSASSYLIFSTIPVSDGKTALFSSASVGIPIINSKIIRNFFIYYPSPQSM